MSICLRLPSEFDRKRRCLIQNRKYKFVSKKVSVHTAVPNQGAIIILQVGKYG